MIFTILAIIQTIQTPKVPIDYDDLDSILSNNQNFNSKKNNGKSENLSQMWRRKIVA